MNAIDKKSWHVGPWLSEPDEVEWIDEVTGYKCLIHRVEELGHLCGYVCVPDDHTLYGCGRDSRIEMLREDVELHDNFGGMEVFFEALSDESDGTVPISLAFKAHGNVTWAGPIPGKDGWWFGFDCGHAGDFAPGITGVSMKFLKAMASLAESFGNTLIYRDIEYVTKECQSLAQVPHYH